MKHIRKVRLGDLSVIAEMMHIALEPYYGGDHRAHAKRIVETASRETGDDKGHFSAAQIMYVVTENGNIVGILNFVAKHQGTVKISPLIVKKEARGQGVSRRLLQKLDEYVKNNQIRQIYCTVSIRNTSALSFFEKQGFIHAGTANCHYRADTDEVMLYKVVEHVELFSGDRMISVLPMEVTGRRPI